MLHDLRIDDGGLLIIAWAGSSERFDCFGGLPVLEDVDPVGLYRIGRDVEVDAFLRGSSCLDHLSAAFEIAQALVGIDYEKP